VSANLPKKFTSSGRLESVKQLIESKMAHDMIMAIKTHSLFYVIIDIKDFESTYKKLAKEPFIDTIVYWFHDPKDLFVPMYQFIGTKVQFCSLSSKHVLLFNSLNHVKGNISGSLKSKYWEVSEILDANKLIPKHPTDPHHSYFDSDVLRMLQRCQLANDESPYTV
jgi:hypothetical protein